MRKPSARAGRKHRKWNDHRERRQADIAERKRRHRRVWRCCHHHGGSRHGDHEPENRRGADGTQDRHTTSPSPVRQRFRRRCPSAPRPDLGRRRSPLPPTAPGTARSGEIRVPQAQAAARWRRRARRRSGSGSRHQATPRGQNRLPTRSGSERRGRARRRRRPPRGASVRARREDWWEWSPPARSQPKASA